MNLIAPGMWIVPVEPLPTVAKTLAIEVPDKPHFCTFIGSTSRRWVCGVCGFRDIHLEVREIPNACFCPTHWRPVLFPKTGTFDALLVPDPSVLAGVK